MTFFKRVLPFLVLVYSVLFIFSWIFISPAKRADYLVTKRLREQEPALPFWDCGLGGFVVFPYCSKNHFKRSNSLYLIALFAVLLKLGTCWYFTKMTYVINLFRSPISYATIIFFTNFFYREEKIVTKNFLLNITI